MRKRAARLAHVPQTNSPYHLPEMGKKSAYTANRAGVAERFAAPAVPKSMEGDLALIDYDDRLLTALALHIVKSAKHHAVHPFYRLRSLPGVGTSCALVLLEEIHALRRFPRGPDVVSYGRLGKGAQEAAGQRSGPAGTTMGNAYLTWAFAEAAALFLRHQPEAQQSLARLANKHGQGQALTMLAPTLARGLLQAPTRTGL
jgi:transposase